MILEHLLSWFFGLPFFDNFRLSLPVAVQTAFRALFNFLSFISPVCDLDTLLRAIFSVVGAWVILIFKIMVSTLQ